MGTTNTGFKIVSIVDWRGIFRTVSLNVLSQNIKSVELPRFCCNVYDI